MPDDLDVLGAAYEQAEAAYLDALRSSASRLDLAMGSEAVAKAALEYNSAAYKALFALGPGDEKYQLDLLTERTEVLEELWLDIAAAYRA